MDAREKGTSQEPQKFETWGKTEQSYYVYLKIRSGLFDPVEFFCAQIICQMCHTECDPMVVHKLGSQS